MVGLHSGRHPGYVGLRGGVVMQTWHWILFIVGAFLLGAFAMFAYIRS